MTPPVNITILRDVLEPFLATNPELQAQFQPIFQAAELSGENNELTTSEARLYLQQSLREASAARSLLTRHREHSSVCVFALAHRPLSDGVNARVVMTIVRP